MSVEMNDEGRYLKFRFSKGYRKLIRLVCSRLYRDDDGDISKSILIAGAARSGTTWLGDIIASQIPCRIMFEPFHSKLVKQYQRFNYYQYMRPGAEDIELYKYARNVFSGEIRDLWIDRQVEHIYFQRRVIKAVRVNLMMKWLFDKFPVVPQIFLIRHPCAVVLSRMQLNWATDTDIEPFLSQAELVEDHLSDKLEIIKRARSDEEKHAIIWCISNLVPIHQFGCRDFNVVFYEKMCINPETEISKIFEIAKLDYHHSVIENARQPSTTSLRSSAILTGEDRITGWGKKLSRRQIADILAVVRDFGLDYIYGDSYTPLVAKR
jgi:hypothetical protein